MASRTYQYRTVDGKMVAATRKKQGRPKSPDPMIAITVRFPKSWLDDMGEDKRHEIKVAVYRYRTQKLVKS